MKYEELEELWPCVFCGRDTPWWVIVTTQDGTFRKLKTALCPRCKTALGGIDEL